MTELKWCCHLFSYIILILPMTQEERERIVRILNEKRAVLNCPRCGHREFTFFDGYFNHNFQQEIGGGTLVLGGPTVPSVATICSHCGFMSFHAAGVLGLLQNKQTNHEETPEGQ